MEPTHEQVERVAEAIRRNKFERNGRLSIYEAGLCSPEEIGEARAAIAAMPALPAQGEPVAADILADFICDVYDRLGPGCDERAIARAILDQFTLPQLGIAAIPSSPALPMSSLNSGESDLQVTADCGAGEAIFEECAEIALEHVGAHSYASHLVTKDRMAGYDEACRDIAEAIRLRASNRKTMDAIADAALLKP